MKQLSTLVLLLLCYYITSAQIVTPGFTRYSACPTSYSQVTNCTGWRQPTGGTSDYFNACATALSVGVPQNILGYQNSIDSAYVGLITYAPTSIYDYKEYIGTSISPLIVGQTYTMSIVISLADNSVYATDGLGVFFSTYTVDTPTLFSTLPLTPQVDYSDYGVIRDKLSWVTLTKTFVADSAYTNLLVGCFKPVSILHIDTVTGGDSHEGYEPYSYYYIGRIGIPDTSNGQIDTTKIVDTTTLTYVFPNVFSPHGDTKNDVFRIITLFGSAFSEYSLSIYNRYGQRVFFTEDPAAGWNGVFNGVPQEIGTYYYMAIIKYNNKSDLVKGDLTLVR
jgi:gliding motility-associated-like protein